MTCDGASGANTVKWTSKYGSLVVSSYEFGTADGMNDKGLVINGLYLAEFDFGHPDNRPTISIMAYGQYLLDNFGSVAEAAEGMRGDSIRVIAPTLPNGRAATAHLSLSDPTGDSAILEYLDGKLIIHHGKQYRVMTNSPRYDQQLAIESYWRGVDPLTFLPGSINAADRFARVSFLIGAIPTKLDPNTIKAVPSATYQNQALASVLRHAFHRRAAGHHPSDQAQHCIDLVAYRVGPEEHGVLVRLGHQSEHVLGSLLRTRLQGRRSGQEAHHGGGKIYEGNAAGRFEPATPFAFMAAKDK